VGDHRKGPVDIPFAGEYQTFDCNNDIAAQGETPKSRANSGQQRMARADSRLHGRVHPALQIAGDLVQLVCRQC
jgi:hypothetical protein